MDAIEAADDKDRSARYAAVLGIIGFVDVPLIFFSVYLWRGIHPEPASMPQQIAITLLVGLFSFALLFIYLFIRRQRIEKARDELDDLRATLEEVS